MLKRTMTFNSFDGDVITEDFYFNLTKGELLEMEISNNGLEGLLNEIVATRDGQRIMDLFKMVILGAVGRKSGDGRRFIKNDEIRQDFEHTEAFSDLLFELCTDAEKGAEFMNGIVPKGAQTELKKGVETVNLPEPVATQPTEPSWITEGRVPNEQELRNATPDQLRLAFQRKQGS